MAGAAQAEIPAWAKVGMAGAAQALRDGAANAGIAGAAAYAEIAGAEYDKGAASDEQVEIAGAAA